MRAITYFDRALHWYTPFNPYIGKSADRLWEIGRHAEEQRDIPLALIAFRTIRRGFYSASHFITPGKDWIDRCDSEIKVLTTGEDNKKNLSEDIKELRRTLQHDQITDSPDIFWTVVLEVGFLGWVGSVIAYIVLVLKRKRSRGVFTFSTLIWIGITIVFFSLWIIGMMKA